MQSKILPIGPLYGFQLLVSLFLIIVFTELSGLQKSNDDKVSAAAVEVVRYFTDNTNEFKFCSSEGNIVPMNSNELWDEGDKNADDVVMKSVQGLIRKYPQVKVVLCTRDVNLRLKCRALGVNVVESVFSLRDL